MDRYLSDSADQKRLSPDEMITVLLKYWSRLKIKQLAPRHTDLNPQQIDNALPYTFVAEEVAQGVARFRVSGQTVNKIAGMETRGLAVSTLFADESQKAITTMLTLCISDIKIIRFNVTDFDENIHAKGILLPMQNLNGEVNRTLGGLFWEGPQALSMPLVIKDYRAENTGENVENTFDVAKLRLVVDNAH